MDLDDVLMQSVNVLGTTIMMAIVFYHYLTAKATDAER